MKKLKILVLSKNQIDTIRRDVFEDLNLIEFIGLGKKFFPEI